MPPSLAKEHRDFFQKQGYIEFSDLLSSTQTSDLTQAIDEVMIQRRNDKCAARDTWRYHPLVKKIVLKRDFAEIACGLTHAKEMYLGYDQGISGHELPTGMISLQQMSCVRPLVAGLLIRLTGGAMPVPEKLPCPCPTAPGQGVFFSSQLLLAWDPLLALQAQRFFLITYASAHPQYILEKRDPCTHTLKQLGLAFGDTLTSETHPLLFS